jgi:hypothetical protein
MVLVINSKPENQGEEREREREEKEKEEEEEEEEEVIPSTTIFNNFNGDRLLIPV